MIYKDYLLLLSAKNALEGEKRLANDAIHALLLILIKEEILRQEEET